MTPVSGLIGLNAILVAIVVWLLIRRSNGALGTLVQQQMVELQARLDTLSDTSRVLAESRAAQTRDLAEQLASFAQVVSVQLDAGRDSVSQRLSDAGDLMIDLRDQLGHLAASAQRLEHIGEGVAQVHELLRVPKLRGTMGETWLEEILKQMIPPALYERHYSFASGERVDCVVRLGDRLLSIDAKFPLDACERMLKVNGNQDERDRHRRAFQKTVRARVDEIVQKYIRPGEGTFDFALMYVPAERVYYEAVTSDDGNLIRYASNRRVVLVSPSTLYAYLATLLHGLRAFHVQRHAQQVADVMSGLQLIVDQVVKTHEILGKHVENASKQHAELGKVLQRMRDQLSGVPGHVPVVGHNRPFSGVGRADR